MRHQVNANNDRSFGEEFIKNISDCSWVLDWIEGAFTVDEVFEPKDIVKFVNSNYNPEDVFNENELAAWAEENGFIQKGE